LLPTYRTLGGIGDELGIGRPTVKTHVQHIYEKLGATNRAEAVQSAVRAGLLPAPAGDVRWGSGIREGLRHERGEMQ
jgi:hypothetical protein